MGKSLAPKTAGGSSMGKLDMVLHTERAYSKGKYQLWTLSKESKELKEGIEMLQMKIYLKQRMKE